MKEKNFRETLETFPIYFYMINYSQVDTSNGWKLSIQGKTLDDAVYLYDKLEQYLIEKQIPHKYATAKLINSNIPQQSNKLLTVYCPNNMDIKDLAEDVYSKIMDYKGWYDVKHPSSYEHYAGGVFFRNDRDINGEYIRAN